MEAHPLSMEIAIDCQEICNVSSVGKWFVVWKENKLHKKSLSFFFCFFLSFLLDSFRSDVVAVLHFWSDRLFVKKKYNKLIQVLPEAVQRIDHYL